MLKVLKFAHTVSNREYLRAWRNRPASVTRWETRSSRGLWGGAGMLSAQWQRQGRAGRLWQGWGLIEAGAQFCHTMPVQRVLSEFKSGPSDQRLGRG